MAKDEILEEVRAIREEYAARFDYDLKRMFEDLKQRETEESAPHAKIRPVKLDRKHP